MLYCYLFEAKSIQSYLFKTGKLKDVIAASERLDLLVDDTSNSVLANVMAQLPNISHDLYVGAPQDEPQKIHFLRCKGGAFYAYSPEKEPLAALRSLWTLTVLQLFPSLEFCDALVSGKDDETGKALQNAMAAGHRQLAADRNQAKVKLPLTPAIAEISQRTGNAAVPVSKNADRAGTHDEKLDLDTELHRQAYYLMGLKEQGALQNKYTPEDAQGYKYPIDLEGDFDFSTEQNAYKGKQNGERKDIALVHIDGNGLGIILRKLNTALIKADETEYAAAFRAFSQSLAKATQTAAQAATKLVVQYGCNDKNKLAMRPLVLGGDDVTLLIRADLALLWSETFCKVFKQASQQELAETIEIIQQDPTAAKDLKDYLTASGGILFQKAGHPFTNSHDLVEGLCKKAKALTKQLDENVGPAALGFMRLSNTATANIDDVIAKNYEANINNAGTLHTGLGAYLVEPSDKAASLGELTRLFNVCRDDETAMTLSKWRQLLTHLSLGDLAEAERIFERDLRINDKPKCDAVIAAFAKLSQQTNDTVWHWQAGDKWVTPLNDLMVLERFYFQPVQGEVA